MPSLLYILLSPLLLIISIPLSLFAALTTTLAFSTLIGHALLVYAELGAILIQNQFSSQHGSKITLAPITIPSAVAEGKSSQHKSRRSSVDSGSNGGSTILEASLGHCSGSGLVRDFEGVGGVSDLS